MQRIVSFAEFVRTMAYIVHLLRPASPLLVVYTRGGNLPSSQLDDYGALLVAAREEPVVDTIVMKLRYRFSS